MNQEIEISRQLHERGFLVRTPRRYAMNVAVEILEFLDDQKGLSVKNTGWKQSFGLNVSELIPIQANNLVAALETDGDELQIRKLSGPIDEFETLIDMVQVFLNGKFTLIQSPQADVSK